MAVIGQHAWMALSLAVERLQELPVTGRCAGGEVVLQISDQPGGALQRLRYEDLQQMIEVSCTSPPAEVVPCAALLSYSPSCSGGASGDWVLRCVQQRPQPAR